MKLLQRVLFIFVFLFNLLFLTGCKEEEAIIITPTPVGDSTVLPVDESMDDLVVDAEVVAGESVELKFPISGIVDEIYIDEGEPVKKGQVIARLTGKEQYDAQLASLELDLLIAQQTLDELFDNADLNSARAQLNLAQAERANQNALDDWNEIHTTKGSINKIELAYAEYILAQNKVDEAERAFNGVQNLNEDDEDRAKVMATLTTARETRDAAQAKYNYLNSRPDDFEAAEIDGKLELAKANLEDAQRNLSELIDGIDPDDLAVNEGRVEELTIQIEAIKEKMGYLDLVSPIDGVVVINNLKNGELIASSVLDLYSVTVADLTSWHIETTDLTEIEIVDIKKNMPVKITFDALPDVQLNGKVNRVKEIGLSKQGDITYTVIVDLDEWDNRILWKMTATVSIER